MLKTCLHFPTCIGSTEPWNNEIVFGWGGYKYVILISSYQVSLSESAEETLEEITTEENNEDVVYYWSPMDMDQTSDFWLTCDSLNAGNCRCFSIAPACSFLFSVFFLKLCF